MPNTARPRDRRFPLHVHISVLFTLLLLLSFAMVFAINHYQAWSRPRYGYGN